MTTTQSRIMFFSCTSTYNPFFSTYKPVLQVSVIPTDKKAEIGLLDDHFGQDDHHFDQNDHQNEHHVDQNDHVGQTDQFGKDDRVDRDDQFGQDDRVGQDDHVEQDGQDDNVDDIGRSLNKAVLHA